MHFIIPPPPPHTFLTLTENLTLQPLQFIASVSFSHLCSVCLVVTICSVWYSRPRLQCHLQLLDTLATMHILVLQRLVLVLQSHKPVWCIRNMYHLTNNLSMNAHSNWHIVYIAAWIRLRDKLSAPL